MRDAIATLISVSTPTTAPPFSTMRDTVPCFTSMFCTCSKMAFILNWYAFLSHWTRGARTAGPFFWLSIRNWIPVASALSPIAPPIASISRTICPLASPPIAGLHDICPIVSRFWVNISVRQPIRAAASAASIPACPLPMTTTSYLFGNLYIND